MVQVDSTYLVVYIKRAEFWAFHSFLFHFVPHILDFIGFFLQIYNLDIPCLEHQGFVVQNVYI